ncbi:MAG: hypothetical protein IRY94_20875, partial [Rhodospirillaceae bacterium]|nr:hypothetical protein [Rhodospirillaceae bacterium]
GIGIGVPLFGWYHHAPPPVYYVPPPVYYVPPPPPPRIYYTPPPAYAPPPLPADAQPVSPAYQGPGGQTCREYSTTVYIGGRPQVSYGTACLQPDGSWRLVD